MYIALLGRQPILSLAELERLYGSNSVARFSPYSATISADNFTLEGLGGTLKAGKVDFTVDHTDWTQISQQIIAHYSKSLSRFEGKITLGISVYDLQISSKQVQKVGLVIKSILKKKGVSLRLVPNETSALSSASSHHNKLGLSENKIEIIVVRGNKNTIVARSIGAQNISAYSKRDQMRPKRDAFVGMLPPKLAQIIINLAAGPTALDADKMKKQTLLDPFCGTGVILQEAALKGYQIYGSDLSQKMIDYSSENLAWLFKTHHIGTTTKLHAGDAMNTNWHQPIDVVATESYLGQPFSSTPSPEKLRQVIKNCDFIISSFMDNLSKQLDTGTTCCIAIPAWKTGENQFAHLPLTNNLAKHGFKKIDLKLVNKEKLLYYREDQIVARELLVIERI